MVIAYRIYNLYYIGKYHTQTWSMYRQSKLEATLSVLISLNFQHLLKNHLSH